MKEGAIRRLFITCDELYACIWLYYICGLDSMNLYDLIMDIWTLFVALDLICTYYGSLYCGLNVIYALNYDYCGSCCWL
jgi:hypothetical protein